MERLHRGAVQDGGAPALLTQEQIEGIAAFDGQGARVLSVYLDVDPDSQVRRSYRIVFKDMVREARERLEGLQPGGSECPACGQIWPGILATCPGCDTPMRPVHDPFRRAIEQAHAQAARVEVVHEEDARRRQEHCGGLGAILRIR